ncbi:hypothetical protein [Pseudonocardia sp. KRD291]|uniref:hypothetical protein n=1 Tax=Pseudonocardia sp. KRD291 TaxID=2792007 RepID=UPI001C49E58D|nr:hypothetical protein [Pseudonocardia sp. KRD291]MBW0103691.1 hypothetical protein [Pseudonocardia sp. KRD291]
MTYDGPAVGQAQVIRRLAGSMARGAALVGVVTSLVCVAVAAVSVGASGVYGAAFAGVVATASALLTPLLMLRTTTLDPAAVMLASFVGLATKAIVLLIVLFTLGNGSGLHRMSLAVTLLVVFVATTAAEAWAGHKIKILIGSDPASSGA